MLTVINRGYLDHKGRTIAGNMPIGNQADKGTYFIDYECYFGSDLSFSLSITTTASSSIITLNGANWDAYGIASGDTIVFTDLNTSSGGTPTSGTAIVAIVNGNELILTSDWVATAMYVTGNFHVNKSPEAVKSIFNLISNDDQSGVNSLIDGTSVSLYNNSISSMSVSDIQALLIGGDISGSAIISANIERLADRKAGLAKSYRVTVNFYCWLFLDNYSSLFDSQNCVTPYVFSEFMPLWNNPAVSLSVGFKLENDGNSGFRNENFNQNTNNFKLNNISFSIGTQSVNGIDYSKPTDFTFEVENIAGLGFAVNLGLILFNDIADEEVYSASNTNNNGSYSHLSHTFFTESPTLLTDGTFNTFSGAIGKNGEQLTISVKIVVAGSIATYTGTVTPNLAFTTTFLDQNNTNRVFALLPRLESQTIPATNFSDTVNLLVWRDEVFAYPPILGSYFDFVGAYDHGDNLI